MNTDSIEVRGGGPAEVRARVESAFQTTLSAVGGIRHVWESLIDADYRMSVTVGRYDGPPAWWVELRGCWVDLDDERNLAIRRWIVGNLWDVLVANTDWDLIWTSDAEPGDGIVRERRSGVCQP